MALSYVKQCLHGSTVLAAVTCEKHCDVVGYGWLLFLRLLLISIVFPWFVLGLVFPPCLFFFLFLLALLVILSFVALPLLWFVLRLVS